MRSFPDFLIFSNICKFKSYPLRSWKHTMERFVWQKIKKNYRYVPEEFRNIIVRFQLLVLYFYTFGICQCLVWTYLPYFIIVLLQEVCSWIPQILSAGKNKHTFSFFLLFIYLYFYFTSRLLSCYFMECVTTSFEWFRKTERETRPL